MVQIRWYHFYVLLAVFDVIVIMSSLYLHGKTLDSVGELIVATSRLDARAEWINRARQRVLELNAPGNDIFQAITPQDYHKLKRQLHTAESNLSDLFASHNAEDFDIDDLHTEIDGILTTAKEIFESFRHMAESPLTDPQRETILLEAGPRMARMDNQQKRALWLLGGYDSKNSDERNQLLHALAARLQSRSNTQRYFFAAVILILVGILAFGRRLQQSEQALALERQKVQEERRERLTAIGELCSSVAHGMRNPLTAICSSVEITLELAKLDEKTQNRLKATLHEGERLNNRINGLLDVARMNLEVQEPVNLTDLVEQAARELKPAATRKDITFELNLSAADIIINGDRGKLELAVIELISNAMEHSMPGDTIRVACDIDQPTDQIIVTVEDEGSGVEPDIRDRIFDLFFSTKPQGTGIGLATVKRISRLHGGDVKITTGAGVGARFAITLPPDNVKQRATGGSVI